MIHPLKAASIATVTTLAFTSIAHAFPDRPVSMIIPFSAGGTNDSVARALAPELAKALKGNVVAKNVDGAAGTLGANAIVTAKPDGHTIGFVPLGPVTVQNHLRDLPYDVDAWKPICNVYQTNLVLVTKKGGPIASVDAMKKMDSVTYGSTGPGTVNHLASAASLKALGIKGKHLPDKGAGPAMLSLANGTIDLFADTPVIVKRYEVTPIAALSAKRLPEVPDVPTMKELGQDVQFSLWAGLFAPAKTPAPVVEQLTAACKTALTSDSFQASAKKIGIQLDPMYGADFEKFVRSQYESMKSVTQAAGIK